MRAVKSDAVDERLAQQLEVYQRVATSFNAGHRPQASARIDAIVGQAIRARLPGAAIGDLCRLLDPRRVPVGLAEVVALDQAGATLLPRAESIGLSARHHVEWLGSANLVEVGDALLGGVLDGNGNRLDDAPQSRSAGVAMSILREGPAALERPRVRRALHTGVRAIDSLLTLGEGQRIGIFAAAGMGKTSLLGMLARGVDIDVCVLALIGERGREVNEFLEHELSASVRGRTVVVVATSDKPAMERRRAAYVATTIAEYFRAQGRRVLLIMDSLTRFARAEREKGLAAGELPVRRGFPPSVFSALPQLLERAGNHRQGSITAVYTVLVEGDDLNEPIADEARSLLDGHIVLSSKLAMAGRFPAIDVLKSRSRVMTQVADAAQLAAAQRVRALLAKHEEIELLVSLGDYQRGHDALGDEALDRIDALRAFLAQDLRQVEQHDAMRVALERVLR
ncbi:MAG: FliI/YscN family ATPase [Janthinobacterium lividum]